jgi:GntR family transcriptional regulator/MocR family aminotransferase
MSVWTRFDNSIDLVRTAENAFRKGLYFSNGIHHDLPHKKFNSTRLGFASSTLTELEMCVEILKSVM